MKKALLLIGCNLGVAIFLLFISEIGVRIFCPQIKPQGTDRDIIADVMYFASPGLRPLSSGRSNGAKVKVDQYGFREFSAKIDDSKSSWLFLGDSVTMGIGVEAESTFAGIIQSSVDSSNILNPSLIGYDVGDYINVLRYFVVDQRYDLRIRHVSLFWCLNDVYADVADVHMPGGKLRYLLSDFLSSLRVHSRLYIFMKDLLFDRSRSYFLFDKEYYMIHNEEFQEAIDRIITMRRLCQEREIKFDVILLPYEYQLRRPSPINFMPQQLMTSMLQAKGIEVFDPAKEAVKQNLSKELFEYGDGLHLSPAGHRYIADFVLKNLKPIHKL